MTTCLDSKCEAAAAALHDERGWWHRTVWARGHEPGWCPYCYCLSVLAVDTAERFSDG